MKDIRFAPVVEEWHDRKAMGDVRSNLGLRLVARGDGTSMLRLRDDEEESEVRRSRDSLTCESCSRCFEELESDLP